MLLASEKVGGKVHSSSQMQGFWDAVAHCNLGDLGFTGDLFTWANSITKCRLDQCPANTDWRNLFRHSKVFHLDPLISDHIPILLQVRQGPVLVYCKHKRSRFEEAWLQREDCAQVISVGWSKWFTGTPSYRDYEKIKAMHLELMKWKNSFVSVKKEIMVVKEQMKVLFQQPSNSVAWNLIGYKRLYPKLTM